MSNDNKSKLNYKDNIEEGFSYIVKDVALKALLFSMVFYIINSNLVSKLLNCVERFSFIEKNFVQAVLFAAVYYLISINL
jgi:hypothetical protein